jgi:hypothetical protein
VINIVCRERVLEREFTVHDSPQSNPYWRGCIAKGMADYIQCYLGKKGQWKKSLLRIMMGDAS